MSTAMEERRRQRLKSVRTFLSRWKGASTQVWEMGAAHPALTFRLTRPAGTGSLELSCLRPTSVKLPEELQWEDSDLEVFDQGENYLVLDREHACMVTCDSLEVVENVKHCGGRRPRQESQVKRRMYISQVGPGTRQGGSKRHVAVVLACEVSDSRTDLAEVQLLVDAEERPVGTRFVVPHVSMIGLEAVAQMAANWANGELGGRDLDSPPLFPIDADLARFATPNLTPLLRLSVPTARKLLEQIARTSKVPAFKDEAQSLLRALDAVRTEASEPVAE